ncbi:hypothetical protein H9P43_006297 [Blastocladiella emersonii ATCC 22665]|nr:hypothetical protein H9P43_006297 [Blastocladiella emersonii ATCC 22665]
MFGPNSLDARMLKNMYASQVLGAGQGNRAAECSHLCHNGGRTEASHILIESHKMNESRKKCNGVTFNIKDVRLLTSLRA